MTKYAGWGMKAVTDIPGHFCLGFFAEKERSAVDVKGEFCIKMARVSG